MMFQVADAVALIGMIVQAANSARMHKQNCKQFARHLKLIGNLLEQLKISELKRHPITQEPLEQLEDALRKAYMLVNRCQNRNYLYRLVNGWNIVNQFKDAQSEIDNYLKLIPLITLVDNTRMKEGLEYIGKDQCEYTLDDEDMQQENDTGYDDQDAYKVINSKMQKSHTLSSYQNHNPVPNPPNTTILAQQQVSPHPYTYPRLDPSSYPYDPKQAAAAAVNYDQSNLNLRHNSSCYSYASSSTSPLGHNYGDSLGYSANFHGYNETGVYKYTRGKPEGSSGDAFLFDNYGRPIVGSGGDEKMAPRVVNAAPKGSVQMFRVMLLSESFGQNDMDVLCQVGLDGILILEPASSRTLKMYPLEAVTRWEVLDSYIFAFWTKTSVDVEPRRVRLKSNPCTTNDILDTFTAASIQVKEIGDINNPSDSTKDHWVPDEAAAKYISCATAFNAYVSKEEIGMNQKSSTGGKVMREVACPTCTVHLQVEVPDTGSETIECSVCQHLFRVSNEGVNWR